MLPDNPVAWGFFALYTIGSVGGIVYIIRVIVDMFMHSYEREQYDPYTAPFQTVYTTKEPPISARKK